MKVPVRVEPWDVTAELQGVREQFALEDQVPTGRAGPPADMDVRIGEILGAYAAVGETAHLCRAGDPGADPCLGDGQPCGQVVGIVPGRDVVVRRLAGQNPGPVWDGGVDQVVIRQAQVGLRGAVRGELAADGDTGRLTFGCGIAHAVQEGGGPHAPSRSMPYPLGARGRSYLNFWSRRSPSRR